MSRCSPRPPGLQIPYLRVLQVSRQAKPGPRHPQPLWGALGAPQQGLGEGWLAAPLHRGGTMQTDVLQHAAMQIASEHSTFSER